MSREIHQIASAPPAPTPTAPFAATPSAEVIDGAGEPGLLDVRSLPHRGRHETIFTRLDQLALGGSVVIVNDHDPKPLRYQTEALWPGRFTWTYLETGPVAWRVEIVRAG